MTEEPKKDLKEEEEKTSTGADQTGATGPDDDDEATGATGASGATGTSGATGASDDQVTVSKSELEQLRKDAGEKENFRKGIIRLNRERGRNLPGSEPEKKPKADEEELDEFGEKKKPEGDFVTRQELALRDEKRAISDACKNEEILLNWDEIIVFYQRPKENTYETQSAAIATAHKKWRAENGITDKPDEKEDARKKAEKAKQDLASDKGLGTGKDKKPTPPKKTIIPRKQKMDDWYK